jgi:hypothetical protein
MKHFNSQILKTILFIVSVAVSNNQLPGQNTEPVQTLFNKDTKLSYLWSPGLKFNSIQGDIGSLIELNGGILFNNTALVGLDRFSTGISYRFVGGLDENNQYVSITNVSNEDMSGINLRVGLVFSGGKKR